MKTIKIIYIIQATPPYGLYENAGRPAINWDTPSGSWVGIWGYEWGDRIGSNILLYHPQYEFEVWQPDIRADRVYAHRFEDGVCHKLFPAETSQFLGRRVISSKAMVEQIRSEEQQHELIIQTSVNAHCGWLLLPNTHHKILGTLHGKIQLPMHELFRLRKNPMRYYHLMREHFVMKKLIRHYGLISYQNDTKLEDLKKIYPGPLHKISMGVDFDQFYPMSQKACRKELGLPVDKKVFLMVGRMNPLKQNDRVIQVFNQLRKSHDFLLVLLGSSSIPGYLDYLKGLAAPLAAEGKIRFPGYKKGEALLKYYNASDLLLMTSKSEGGPVVSMEAIACGVPVFSTRTGYIAELLEQHRAGYVAGIRNYHEWGRVLGQFLNGEREIATLDKASAANEFSWRSIADKFDAAYQHLADSKSVSTPW